MKKLLFFLLFIPLVSFGQTASDLIGNGFWLQQGYGRLLEINKKSVVFYDISKSSQIKLGEIPVKYFLEGSYKFDKIQDSSFTILQGINEYDYKKVNKNYFFDKEPSKNNKDPLYNFESVWNTFNENYAYFKERNIDWGKIEKKYRSKILNNTSELDLFVIIRDMLNELNDGHVRIFPPSKIQKKLIKVEDNTASINNKKSDDEYWNELMQTHTKNYKSYNFGLINWGKINEDLSIIQINTMMGLANYKLSESLFSKKGTKSYNKQAEKSSNYYQDELDGVKVFMNKAFNDIKSTKACIIDLRFNGGGYDAVALEILSFFSNQSTTIFTKKARVNQGFTRTIDVTVPSSSLSYSPRIYILTSNQTASAAEIFVLGSIEAIPDAIRIGSNTEGIFSDVLEKRLPNGWNYGLSNEVYQSLDGNNYENIGVEPHHYIDYPKDEQEFYKKLMEADKAIEKVIKIESQLQIKP